MIFFRAFGSCDSTILRFRSRNFRARRRLRAISRARSRIGIDPPPQLRPLYLRCGTGSSRGARHPPAERRGRQQVPRPTPAWWRLRAARSLPKTISASRAGLLAYRISDSTALRGLPFGRPLRAWNDIKKTSRHSQSPSLNLRPFPLDVISAPTLRLRLARGGLTAGLEAPLRGGVESP